VQNKIKSKTTPFSHVENECQLSSCGEGNGASCIPNGMCDILKAKLATVRVHCEENDEYSQRTQIAICGKGVIEGDEIWLFPNSYSRNCSPSGKCLATVIFHEFGHNAGTNHDGLEIPTPYMPMNSADAFELNCRGKLCAIQ